MKRALLLLTPALSLCIASAAHARDANDRSRGDRGETRAERPARGAGEARQVSGNRSHGPDGRALILSDNRDYRRGDRRPDNRYDRRDTRPAPRRVEHHYVPAPRYRSNTYIYVGSPYPYWHGRPYSYRPYQWQSVNYYSEPEYISSYSEVRCTDSYNPFGTLLGAGIGGLAGSTIGSGGGRTAAIIGGAMLGGLVGTNITRQHCTEEVFRTAPLGQPVSWQAGPGEAYAVVPVREYSSQADGRYCREYQSYAMVGGRRSETYGTACMQPDGSWQIVN